MDKKLPGVFANRISSSAAHNDTVYYTNSNHKEKISNKSDNKFKYQNINQKINSIFNSQRYVYKADVKIKLKDETIKRKIIGKNSLHLITMDNELIPISDIVDIDFDD